MKLQIKQLRRLIREEMNKSNVAQALIDWVHNFEGELRIRHDYSFEGVTLVIAAVDNTGYAIAGVTENDELLVDSGDSWIQITPQELMALTPEDIVDGLV